MISSASRRAGRSRPEPNRGKEHHDDAVSRRSVSVSCRPRSYWSSVGIEITAPQSVSLERLNQLLKDLGEVNCRWRNRITSQCEQPSWTKCPTNHASKFRVFAF